MLLPSSRKPLLKPGAFSSNLSFQEKSLPNKQQYLLFQPSSCFSEETDRVYLIKKNLGRRSCSVEKGGGRREEGEKGEKRKEGGRGARMGEGAGGTIVEEKEGKMKKIGGREDEKREEEWKCFECAEMKSICNLFKNFNMFEITNLPLSIYSLFLLPFFLLLSSSLPPHSFLHSFFLSLASLSPFFFFFFEIKLFRKFKVFNL